ncbi:MAG TPA: hypothetical protein ENF77_00015 [Candidatus Acetothermia bacterium]|nr:hypothetical protein [Candidatus Acetothermia bacterium]
MCRRLVFALVLASFVGLLFPAFAQAQVMGEGRRDPMIHGLASFVVPGLGQYLNGEPDKALVHFLVALAIPVVGYTVAFYAPYGYPIYYLVPLLQLGWAAYSALDAYETAERYNREHGFSLLEFDFSLGG